MKKNVSMIRKASGLGLAGVLALGASSAMAVEFGASADIQSTLAVTVVNDLSFGTLYAASASSGEVDSIRLGTDGTFTGDGEFTASSLKILSLGGTIQPAQGTVATSQSFTLDLPDDTGAAVGGLADDANVTKLTIAGGDPDVAKLLVTRFRVGELVGGTFATGVDATAQADVTIDPDFNATDVTFNIGADVMTDDKATATTRNTYEDGTYTGTFEVTASF